MTDPITIETRIAELKSRANEYEKMSDQDKIKNLNEYDKIITEKELCIDIINTYKYAISNTNNENNTNAEFDVSILMENINNIKKRIEDNDIPIHELIDLHRQLSIMIGYLNKYFHNKKLEIIQLP